MDSFELGLLKSHFRIILCKRLKQYLPQDFLDQWLAQRLLGQRIICGKNTQSSLRWEGQNPSRKGMVPTSKQSMKKKPIVFLTDWPRFLSCRANSLWNLLLIFKWNAFESESQHTVKTHQICYMTLSMHNVHVLQKFHGMGSNPSEEKQVQRRKKRPSGIFRLL